MSQPSLAAQLAIHPASSCQRRLAWDCEFSESPDPSELCSALRAAGYVDDSRADWLHELCHQAGHRVLIVPRTARVQLRLHYLTPARERSTTARRLADDLAQIWLLSQPEPARPRIPVR